MGMREGLERLFTGKKRSGEEKPPCSAARLRCGSLRSPTRCRAAEHLPQSVTHAVGMKCYLCDGELPSLALP